VTALSLLAAGLVLLERERTRRFGGAGLVLLALGIAAGARGHGSADGFGTVNGGVLLLGMALASASVMWRSRPQGPMGWVGLALALGGLLLLGRDTVRLLSGARLLASVTAACGLAAAGAGLLWMGRRSGVAQRIGTSAPPLAEGRHPGALVVLVAAVAATVLGSHVPVVLAGGMVSGWAAWLAVPGSARPWPWAQALTTTALGATLWFLATVAGPEGLGVAAISWLPLSPPAERLTALGLLGGAWALFGLWPVRQPGAGSLTAVAGAGVLVRVGLPAATAGLEHWRPAAIPLALPGLWYAALTRRPTAMAVAGAWIGLATARPYGAAGAVWLLLAAVGFELERRIGAGPSPGLRSVFRAVIVVPSVIGGFLVLGAGLDTEVVYTVIAAAATALGTIGAPEARTPSSFALTPPGAGSIFGAETR
jgi:hypothetical protein